MSSYIGKRRMILVPALTLVLVILLMVVSIASAGGPILHKVHVGGPDLCDHFGLQPGCDANFSLNAKLFVDGSVSGQWTDQFGGGWGGFHAVIDCLSVEGNEAWVSGVITQGVFHDLETGEDFDFTGFPVGTRLVDNGTSANDPPDQISFSFVGDSTSCTEQPDYELLDVPRGQVKVD